MNQTVSVQFVGANPRVRVCLNDLVSFAKSNEFFSYIKKNDLRLEGTFLTVEQSGGGDDNDDDDGWTAVRTDSHPSTTFQWVQTSTLLGTSAVTVNWTIGMD